MNQPYTFGFRVLLILAFAMFVPALIGCSVVRTIGMAGVGVDNTPVPPDGKRQKLHVNGDLILGPSIFTSITVHKPVAEVVAFFHHEFVERGWHESQSDELPTVDMPTSTYEFTRESTVGKGSNAWTYARETITMMVTIAAGDKKRNGTVHVEITIDGKYAWDAPSKLILDAIGAVMGNAEEAFVWVLYPL